ncbi:hypothetical protein [Bradyrhizobium elkanii]|uniref:hypothetical protein n=1 Tax=Bradyrhizobium elkanii TaxID=29448 RepID=UPI0004AE4A6D|nr:hypothetical protein [Bradyrhizobium elkanii]
MKMTDGEKLIVLMLADISKRLQGEPEVDPDFVEQTIYADQLWGFDWHFSGIPFERSEEPNPVVKETLEDDRSIPRAAVLIPSHSQKRQRG